MINLSKFFTDRPAISKKAFCHEAGISTRSLYFYIDGKRSPSPETEKRIQSVMKKYGAL